MAEEWRRGADMEISTDIDQGDTKEGFRIRKIATYMYIFAKKIYS